MNLRRCDNCGCPIAPGAFHFVARLQLFAAPDIALDPGLAPKNAYGDAVAKLASLSDSQAREAEAEVFEQFQFFLCPNCRSNLRRDLLRHHPSTHQREDS